MRNTSTSPPTDDRCTRSHVTDWARLVMLVAITAVSLSPAHVAAQPRTSENDPRLERWLKRHPAADADRNGILTIDEAREFRKRLEARRAEQEAAALKPTLADIPYGPHPRHVLDLFRANADRPTPVLIFFHGGGFVAGDKKKAATQPISSQCLEAGISVVSANYRYVRKGPDGAPAAPFPGPMEDAARVVQFVRSKAPDWNIDPEKVALSGGSAGAVMALWTALHDEQADPGAEDPLARISTRVTAAISYGGPTSLEPQFILEHVGGNPAIHPSLNPFFGIQSMDDMRKPEKAALAKAASPINYVTKDDPPLYLKHGGTVAGAPLPASASFGKSIHHAMFGKLLKDRCESLGLQCILACRDATPEMSEIQFLKTVFQIP